MFRELSSFHTVNGSNISEHLAKFPNWHFILAFGDRGFTTSTSI